LAFKIVDIGTVLLFGLRAWQWQAAWEGLPLICICK